MPSSRGSSRSRDQTLRLMCAALAASLMSLALVGRFFTTTATWKAPIYGLKSPEVQIPKLLLVCKGFQNYCLSTGCTITFCQSKLKLIFYILSYYDLYLLKIIHTFGWKGKRGQIQASIKIKSTSVYFPKNSFLNWCFRNILYKKQWRLVTHSE